MMGKGLKSASKADIAIMQEFFYETEKVILESEEAYYDYSTRASNTGFEETHTAFAHDFDSIRQTEKIIQVKTRTVQQFFRTAVISSYHFKCAVCELGLQEMLTASHIIPWSRNEQCRTDPANGISLCTLHDRAFDRGFLAINDDYSIFLSKKITSASGHIIELMFKRFEKQTLKLPFRFLPNIKYLKWHRDNVFLNS
jgi:putative restriction endonuclease